MTLKRSKFIHWDFHKFAKTKSANVLAVLGAVASEALDLTGFYYSGKPLVTKRRTAQISRTSTARDSTLRDLRANSVDISRVSGALGGGRDQIQCWDVGVTHARLFSSFIGGHQAWTLELL